MSVKIKAILLNKQGNQAYGDGETLEITVRLENQADEPATALLEAVLKSQAMPFPTLVRHAQVPLEPREEVEVIVYDLKIDEKFRTDNYTVYVGLANQLGEGSKKQKTFRVKTLASFA